MDVYEAATTRRTVRQFRQVDVSREALEKLVNAARLAPSARNLQPLEYVIVDSKSLLEGMFKCMGFGGGISDMEGREPAAYIIVLANKGIAGQWKDYDAGMAVENIVLCAHGLGIGSCILAKIDRERIRKLLQIPDNYSIEIAVELGWPDEKPVAEEGSATDYYRDSKGVLHVPKRSLKSITHINGF